MITELPMIFSMKGRGSCVADGIMECDAEGFYKPMQCRGPWYNKECFCVDQSGTEIAGTRGVQWPNVCQRGNLFLTGLLRTITYMHPCLLFGTHSLRHYRYLSYVVSSSLHTVSFSLFVAFFFSPLPRILSFP